MATPRTDLQDEYERWMKSVLEDSEYLAALQTWQSDADDGRLTQSSGSLEERIARYRAES